MFLKKEARTQVSTCIVSVSLFFVLYLSLFFCSDLTLFFCFTVVILCLHYSLAGVYFVRWEPTPWVARRVKLDHMERVVFNPAYAFCKVRPPILYNEEATEILITNVPVIMYKDRFKELDTMPSWAVLIQRTAYAQWFSGPRFVDPSETSSAPQRCVVCTHCKELGADTTECDHEDLSDC